MVRQEHDVRVARAAATVLCAHVPWRAARSSPSLVALTSVSAGPRVRELAESLDARDDQLLEIARCLRGAATPSDIAALAQLRRRSPRLRRLLARLR